jgi:2-polyprenyl-3-methyl-5-hydroxy-6-metoxy-1,4-benzoquinol methylase
MKFLKNNNVTRGDGLLENFLSLQRSRVANRLIPGGLRKGKILDIGCGSSPFFLNNTLFREKFAIDKVYSLNQKSINFIRYDFEINDSLPFMDNFFDVVTLLAVIEHIYPEKALSLIRDINRILKSNGVLILTTPAAWSDKLLRIMARLNIVSPDEINEHKDMFTAKKLRKLLIQSGFHLSKIYIGYFELYANIWLKAEK